MIVSALAYRPDLLMDSQPTQRWTSAYNAGS